MLLIERTQYWVMGWLESSDSKNWLVFKCQVKQNLQKSTEIWIIRQLTLTKLPILNSTCKTIHASSQVKLQVLDFQDIQNIGQMKLLLNASDSRFCLFMLLIEHVRERRDSKRYQIQTRFQFQVKFKKFREILEISVSRPVSLIS